MDDIEFVIAVTKGSEDDPVAVGRPGGTEVVAAVCQFDQTCAVDVDDVNVTVALWTAVEGEAGSIGGPSVSSAHVVEIRDLTDIRTVSVHDKKLTRARARGGKRDHRTVR